MKKVFALLLALAMCAGLMACGSAPADDSVKLVVFAAASLTETLTELGEQYVAENNNVSISFNFDSSGTLKTQIQEGAYCDIFLSAGQKQMNELECVLEGTRFDILENKVALAVPEGNPAGIDSFDQLADSLKSGDVMLAVGNSDVPVGQYTQKIFAYYEIDEAAIASKLTYGSNAKEVTTQVSEGAVDCGIVYDTDAFSAGLTVVDSATAEMCGQVIYPAAVINSGEQAEAAQAFLDYLCTDEALAHFEAVGFSPMV